MNKILSTFLLFASLPAFAGQVLVGKPDDTLSGVASKSEPTLIRIEGHRIRRIFGAEGEFSVIADKEAGTAYVKPSADRQSISMFVSDERGRTWKLLLAVREGPSESIAIRPRGSGRSTVASGRDDTTSRMIKRAVAAALGQGAGDYGLREANEVVPLWSESLFVLEAVAEGELRAERYRLTNTSTAPMVIDERELYRANLLAVAVANPKLKPGETTDVVIVMEPADE